MDLLRTLAKRMPSSSDLPSLEKFPTFADFSRTKDRYLPRLAFFGRRIKLGGNSKITVPLGVVLSFPVIVIITIILLFVRHPSSPGGMLIPAGAPPSIRRISEKYDKVFVTGCLTPGHGTAPSKCSICRAGKRQGAGWCYTISQVN